MMKTLDFCMFLFNFLWILNGEKWFLTYLESTRPWPSLLPSKLWLGDVLVGGWNARKLLDLTVREKRKWSTRKCWGQCSFWEISSCGKYLGRRVVSELSLRRGSEFQVGSCVPILAACCGVFVNARCARVSEASHVWLYEFITSSQGLPTHEDKHCEHQTLGSTHLGFIQILTNL